jgi:hypothetical protein
VRVALHRVAAALVVAGLAACFRSHPAIGVAVEPEQCATCHLAEYQATTTPVHAGAFPETCADCHLTTGWQPALEGLHPEAPFPISAGGHAGIKCLDCHDLDRGPGAGGADTVCTTCHDQPTSDDIHDRQPGYAFDAASPTFCLACHPAGVAEIKHSEDAFPIARGRHHVRCGDCHDRDLGPDGVDNTTCIGCHTGAHHRDPSKPHGCLRCHPSGGHAQDD